jgi:hypothetical protein
MPEIFFSIVRRYANTNRRHKNHSFSLQDYRPRGIVCSCFD